MDPVIIKTLPKDDNYTLIIHDAIYRGRQDFNYRIHLGTIPFVTGRYPAYGVAGKKVEQQIEGVNLGTERAKAKVKVKREQSRRLFNDLVVTQQRGLYPCAIRIFRSNFRYGNIFTWLPIKLRF